MSLLEKAKSKKVFSNKHGRYNSEELELAIAYIKGDVTASQALYALGYQKKNTVSLKSRMMTILRNALRDGKVKVIPM